VPHNGLQSSPLLQALCHARSRALALAPHPDGHGLLSPFPYSGLAKRHTRAALLGRMHAERPELPAYVLA